MNREGASRPRVGVLTLDPRVEGSGVFTMQNNIRASLERLGMDPEFVFISMARRERIFLRPERIDIKGRAGVRVGYVPSIDFLNYLTPSIALHRWLSQYQAWQVVSGTSAAAVPLVAARLPFVSWLATTSRSEMSAARFASGGMQPTLSNRINNRLMRVNEAVEGFVLRRTPALFALSHQTSREFEAHRLIDTPVLYPPIDLDKFANAPPADFPKPYVLGAGRVDDLRKDFATLVQAMVVARRRVPELRLVIAGDISPDSSVARMAKETLGDHAIFPGRLNGAALASAFTGAQMFALSSRQEGLGLVVAEAMAASVPVVQMRCGGADELAEDGKTGFLIERGDVESFGQRIADIATNEPLRKAMGIRVRQKAEELFSPDRFDATLKEAYRKTFPGVFDRNGG